jgi:phosphate starvation-inducible protein PhoH and related proteins
VQAPTESVLEFADNHALREVAGEFGAHLTAIGKAFGVEVQQRGSALRVVGPAAGTASALRALRTLGELVERGRPVDATEVHHVVRALIADPATDVPALYDDVLGTTVEGRAVSPRTATQRQYLAALRAHDVVFGIGPAGTGKTYLAVAAAVAALRRGDAKRLILTRPAVEAGEKLGFLPGDLSEKVDPYLRPLFDALHDLLPVERVQKMLEKRVIEVAPLAFMRGRTLASAWVLLDEGQNTTREQMKMFLTRLGHDSKMVITGDPSQIDLPRHTGSGLLHALDVLSDVPTVGVVRFTSADVVRHPMVAQIVDAYDRYDGNAG